MNSLEYFLFLPLLSTVSYFQFPWIVISHQQLTEIMFIRYSFWASIKSPSSFGSAIYCPQFKPSSYQPKVSCQLEYVLGVGLGVPFGLLFPRRKAASGIMAFDPSSSTSSIRLHRPQSTAFSNLRIFVSESNERKQTYVLAPTGAGRDRRTSQSACTYSSVTSRRM